MRRDDGELHGYQRPEQVAHIDQIRTFLETPNALLPNAVVIAFDKSVRFVPAQGMRSTAYSRSGELVIPLFGDDDDVTARPGFIVDGQQRCAAIREAEVTSFPVCVSAFLAESIGEQSEQFILVNSTKPLPKGLIYELLPSTEALLPIQLERRRLPSAVVTLLNNRADSPLFHNVKTATNPSGVVKDNSLLRMIENSLSDGALYRLRLGGEHSDAEAMYDLVAEFFRAVRETWPDAWALPPKKSRLTHGAGIAGLGFLMDATAHRRGARRALRRVDFLADLVAVAPACHWTTGAWKFSGGRVVRWDQVQNTPSDIELLTNHLAAEFKRRALR